MIFPICVYAKKCISQKYLKTTCCFHSNHAIAVHTSLDISHHVLNMWKIRRAAESHLFADAALIQRH